MNETAIFTLVHNEPVWLPRWLRHYGQTGAALYVLDDGTDDGSTAGSLGGASRFPVRPAGAGPGPREVVVREFARRLADGGFGRVVFAPVDEFLVPDPLRHPSLAAALAQLRPGDGVLGYALVPRPAELEARLPPGAPLLNGRRWCRVPALDRAVAWDGSSVGAPPVDPYLYRVAGRPGAWTDVGETEPVPARLRNLL